MTVTRLSRGLGNSSSPHSKLDSPIYTGADWQICLLSPLCRMIRIDITLWPSNILPGHNGIISICKYLRSNLSSSVHDPLTGCTLESVYWKLSTTFSSLRKNNFFQPLTEKCLLISAVFVFRNIFSASITSFMFFSIQPHQISPLNDWVYWLLYSLPIPVVSRSRRDQGFPTASWVVKTVGEVKGINIGGEPGWPSRCRSSWRPQRFYYYAFLPQQRRFS